MPHSDKIQSPTPSNSSVIRSLIVTSAFVLLLVFIEIKFYSAKFIFFWIPPNLSFFGFKNCDMSGISSVTFDPGIIITNGFYL